ncbi:TenA family protein [Mangrovicoccus algicola]|uniref:Aminopyrimidine aminohydrolase n=1 Tax=Mangrovicoccus algicola TaxID=2771008 RepID=A0A8J7D089_9RHOB|nr:TenA family protein [Mangrovicoccus algicola]MBE3639118.1 TenA family protein [Mangrovicoccus algicola]
MRPCEMLRDSCRADWDAATDHAFCRALAAGTLPRDRMAWYLGQDYLFIEEFVRLLAAAVAHAPSLADGLPAARFLGLIAGPENDYFQRSFEALELTPAERAPAPSAPAAGFMALMARARRSGRYEQMIAVLLVAEWSYLSWGERHAGYDPALPFWFAEWIDLHSGPGFAGVVAYLQEQMDGAWPGLDAQAAAEAAAMFREAVALERAFFDAAWAGGDSAARAAAMTETE